MKLKLLLLTSICLLLSTVKVLAQDVDTTKKFNDYVISLKNDTIKCHIGRRFLGKLTYKVDGVRGQSLLMQIVLRAIIYLKIQVSLCPDVCLELTN